MNRNFVVNPIAGLIYLPQDCHTHEVIWYGQDGNEMRGPAQLPQQSGSHVSSGTQDPRNKTKAPRIPVRVRRVPRRADRPNTANPKAAGHPKAGPTLRPRS